jgi:signal transduction histidine kinase
VSDCGPGVPEAHRERVFAPFERVAASAEITGTCPGLSVVRDLARAHGGRAYVLPREGGGARFVVEIPSEVPA